MRKLVLDLDGLEVESFDASGEREERGTVRGHDDGSDGGCSGTWCPTNCWSGPCYCHLSDSGCSCDPC